MLEFDTGEKRLFEFAVDGEQFAIPAFDSFKVDEAMALYQTYIEGSEEAAMQLTKLVRDIFDEHAPGVVERLTLGQWNMLGRAYLDDAQGISAGES